MPIISVHKRTCQAFSFLIRMTCSGFPPLETEPSIIAFTQIQQHMFATDQNSLPIFGCVFCRTHLILLPIPSSPPSYPSPPPSCTQKGTVEAQGLVYMSVTTLYYPQNEPLARCFILLLPSTVPGVRCLGES